MTQPLRQNVAIWIVVICVLEAGPHLFHLFPSSILQSEGLWQHKGLGKHNTISVASSILICNGLATQKRARLLEVDVYLKCGNVQFRFLLDGLAESHAVGEHLQWASLCFLHYKQLCWASWLTTLAYPHKPWTHRTCCWQGNSAD